MNLSHSPSQITRQLLIDLALGTNPPDNDPWPVFYNQLPDSPDSAIVVFDTAGILEGRFHVGGETQQHPGLQIRVRATSNALAHSKARAIAVALDSVFRQDITVDSSSYLVQALTHTSTILNLGAEVPTSRRYSCTINYVIAVTES